MAASWALKQLLHLGRRLRRRQRPQQPHNARGSPHDRPRIDSGHGVQHKLASCGSNLSAHRAFTSQRQPCRATALRTQRQCRCTASSEASPQQSSKPTEALYSELAEACTEYKRAPPSVKREYSADILEALNQLKQAGAAKKWGKIMEEGVLRRNIFLGDLKQVGIKAPDQVAIPSVRNDAAFLYTLVGGVSIFAVLTSQLPGDWGFFVPYLSGGVVLVVLAVGSTAPGLLTFFTSKFQSIFPDYRERVLKHEAGHFLIGYLLGVPITGYSLDIGKEHTDFAEAALQQRLLERRLTDDEVNKLAIMSMSGVSAEAQTYEEVIGQTQDLMDLQRILRRSENKLGDQAQQNMTRWAVYQAASALRKHEAEYKALMTAMQKGGSVAECIKAIEAA